MNVRNELAPSGNLRAGMNLGNTLFTRKNSLGELEGVSVDLMRELAKRLEVPLEMISFAQKTCGMSPSWPLKKPERKPFLFPLQ